MRGFARGGITPVDFCAGCGAGGEDVVSELGGERYAVLQNDLFIPIFGDDFPLLPSLYFDVGSAWRIDTESAPAGVLIDDRTFRSSAGVALTSQTPLGDFSVSYAFSTNSEDFDDTERFTLSFQREF